MILSKCQLFWNSGVGALVILFWGYIIIQIEFRNRLVELSNKEELESCNKTKTDTTEKYAEQVLGTA